MKTTVKLSLLVVCLTALFALAEANVKLDDDLTLKLGADVRARWEGFDGEVVNPDVNTGDTQYLRVRTRVWAALDLAELMTLNIRLGNRIHHVSTSPADPNNRDGATWEFPDEVYLDQLNVVFHKLGIEGLSLTLGRQQLGFGNGMIWADPTPFDQGRSAYTDGVSLKYKTETDSITGFITYDTWKDRLVFINDQNRRLRSGDVFSAGTYWTHHFRQEFNIDLYYIFQDVDDRHPLQAERCHNADASTSLHTVGIRLFGSPLDWLDYSLEAAQQAGRDAEGDDNKGKMLDARLNFHLSELMLASMKPVLGFEYTHFSGDKPGTDDQEGWNPLMSQCPLWQEELIPILLNGNWTNLNLFKSDLSVKPLDNLRFTLGATGLFADEPDAVNGNFTSTGSGNFLGWLVSTSGSYKFSERMSFLAQLSRFSPGDYFGNGHGSYWGRFEILLTF